MCGIIIYKENYKENCYKEKIPILEPETNNQIQLKQFQAVPSTMVHETYKTIIKLVKSNKPKEPFYPKDILNAIKAKNPRTLQMFPARHRKGNPQDGSELFTQLKDGRYKLIRPFKYGLK